MKKRSKEWQIHDGRNVESRQAQWWKGWPTQILNIKLGKFHEVKLSLD